MSVGGGDADGKSDPRNDAIQIVVLIVRDSSSELLAAYMKWLFIRV